tara:strand:- start:622 stop:975 length:354 start_codon:yes stop_codon:yes gene_type:complete
MTVEDHRNKINAIKKSMRMTLGELAQESGLSEAWICRYLRGKHDNPTHRTTEKLDTAVASIIKQRQQQWMSVPGAESTTDDVLDIGHPHDGADGLVPPEGAAPARTEDQASSNDSSV